MRVHKQKLVFQSLSIAKWIVISSVFVVSFQAKAQLDRFQEEIYNYYSDYSKAGAWSVFQDFKTGTFSGSLSGVLYLQKNGEKEPKIFNFCDEKVTLLIKFDQDSIYDVSSKHYIFKRSDIQLCYTTYFRANQLEVIIGKDTCYISCIDGASDGDIIGLEYAYQSDKNNERLNIYLSKDLGLWDSNHKSRISTYVVKKGSVLCFDISRKWKRGKLELIDQIDF